MWRSMQQEPWSALDAMRFTWFTEEPAHEMPANVEEVKQAEEEGVRITFLTVPVEVLGSDGKVTGLKCLRARLAEPDDKGRRKPVPVAGSDHVIEVDAIVTAIGQRVDREGLDSIRESPVDQVGHPDGGYDYLGHVCGRRFLRRRSGSRTCHGGGGDRRRERERQRALTAI